MEEFVLQMTNEMRTEPGLLLSSAFENALSNQKDVSLELALVS